MTENVKTQISDIVSGMAVATKYPESLPWLQGYILQGIEALQRLIKSDGMEES